jgi:hypothetical protein
VPKAFELKALSYQLPFDAQLQPQQYFAAQQCDRLAGQGPFVEEKDLLRLNWIDYCELRPHPFSVLFHD